MTLPAAWSRLGNAAPPHRFAISGGDLEIRSWTPRDGWQTIAAPVS